MYLPSTTPSQRAFNAKRDIARGNIEGEPMAIAKLAGIELAALREEKEALTRQVMSLKSEISAQRHENDILKVEAFDLKTKIDRYKIAVSEFSSDRGPSLATIKNVVCKAYRIPLSALKGKRRMLSEVTPRHIAMYLCKTLTGESLPSIGRSFGGRDHSTVKHAVDKVAFQRLTDSELDNELTRLTALIMGNAG